MVADPGANQPKPAESVKRLDAPSSRSVSLSSRLNTYRFQTFGTRMDVEHKNVLYTAAYRHAVYLNGVNCDKYVSSGVLGVPPGTESSNLTETNTYADLRFEAFLPAASTTGVTYIFPALFTNDDLWSRIAAVVGGPDLLTSGGPKTVNEFYIFAGAIQQPGAGGDPSEFRGFNLDTLNNTNPGLYQFDAVDHVWYSRRGRRELMRAALRYFGFATPQDGDVSYYPWPLLDGRFLGTLTTVSQSPAVAMLGYWPNNNNTNVCPYGLDTDVQTTVTAPTGFTIDQVAPNQYSGPPIHFTIPVNEPFLLNTSTSNPAGGVEVYFRKMETDPETGVDQTISTSVNGKFFTAYFTGLNGGIWNWRFATGTRTDFDYLPCASTETFEVPDVTRNGELIILPTAPLDPLSWYEVGVKLRTVSYALPDTTDPDKFFVVQFKTTNQVAPR